MMQNMLFRIKHLCSQILGNRKKESDKSLKDAFVTLKDDAFDFDRIETYFRNKDHSKAHQVLSDKTCNDLDFDELFMFLDRTGSKVGQQYLYNTLRAVTTNKEQTHRDETIITELLQNSELRRSTHKKLKKLKNKAAYDITTLFQDKHIKPPKWFFVIKLLSFSSLLALLLSFYNPVFLFVLLGIFCINFVLHYWNKNNLTKYLNSIPQLLILNNVASLLFLNPLFKKVDPKLSKSIALLNKIKSRMWFFQLETKFQGEFEIIAWFFFEVFKTTFLLEPLLLFSVLKRLNTKRTEIENVFQFVGHIDMLMSITALRHGLETFCLPTITNNNQINVEAIEHPLIYNCTPNSINISKKSILLTGSNMSGKTSFIRAIGINIITGLTINTCFAKAITFPILNVFSAIRINDDVMNAKSYYFEEVLTIKEMIKESNNGKRNLFLLDELFKGTNTIERISAGKAVLSALAKGNNTVLVSTHDIELTDLLKNDYHLYHFSEVVNNNKINFDYTLKEGKLSNRNAIRILEINEYPKDVISEAIDIARTLDQVQTKR